MAYPINEQIARKVLARLQGITTDNGYAYTANVYRVGKRAASKGSRDMEIHERDEEPLEEGPQGRQEWMKPFTVVCYAYVSDSSSTPLSEIANEMTADVYKRVCTDRFWDGLAINTFIRPPRQMDRTTDGVYAVEATFDVHYATLEDDPYTQG